MPTSLKTTALRIGFIPLLDAAPLVAAQELGLFQRARLNVRLKNEPGWATIYDKLLFGEIDAAHALAGQALALHAQASGAEREFPVPCFLNRGGSWIVLAKRWTDQGVTRPHHLLAAARSVAHGQRLTFGAVHQLSSHGFLLEEWLKQGGAHPNEVQIVHLPPPLLARSLRLGHLDGFCAGEPWCTQSALEGWGIPVAAGESLELNHPDKVLIISRNCREARRDDCVAMLRAVIAAARWCDDLDHHPALADMLAKRPYLDLPADLLRQALAANCITLPNGAHTLRVRFDHDAIHPDGARLAWLAKQWRAHQWDGVELLPKLLDSTLFSEAAQRAGSVHESDSCRR